jgi:uncharacterized membrane protein
LAVEAREAVGESFMEAKRFINQLNDGKIVAAIAEAESGTSGEIRVFVTEHEAADALKEARTQFTRMGMEKTAERNGVLIYVAPKSQTFAVVGDAGVHAKCGENFWDATAAKMQTSFKEEKFVEGLIEGIRSVGEILGRHFPRKGDDWNELPDSVERD